MITASIVHDVKTSMKTFSRMEGQGVDSSSIFERISAGRSQVSAHLPPLKHGRALEDEAVNALMQTLISTHKNAKPKMFDIFIWEEMPFLGGSPDRIISCDYCRQSCRARFSAKCAKGLGGLGGRAPSRHVNRP